MCGLGGVPYYLSLLRTSESLAQNVDMLFFSKNAELKQEYKRFSKSLFKNPEKYMGVVKTLSENRAGLSKSELAEKLGVSNNGHLSELLEDLENCDFISRYNVKQKKISAKNSIYRLKDMYSIFFLEFSKVLTTDPCYWSKSVNSQTQSTWWGLAFERLCMDHVEQILSAIGVRAVHTEYYSWRWAGEERKKIAGRISSFRKNTGTKYGIVPTLITTYGLKRGINSGYFNGSVVTIADLLEF